ncbi:hypothetical protein Hypma_016561 [Hypsizygus marmoreus]|uniref:Uncharacterized protein n=1 Tax=Hypsizygus marmoreus TaxID=39966 RepID=A0A369J7E6_HYPMA|nr:hypothetical protein Hypma_016561 [Hypsizygus marmoreus]
MGGLSFDAKDVEEEEEEGNIIPNPSESDFVTNAASPLRSSSNVILIYKKSKRYIQHTNLPKATAKKNTLKNRQKRHTFRFLSKPSPIPLPIPLNVLPDLPQRLLKFSSYPLTTDSNSLLVFACCWINLSFSDSEASKEGGGVRVQRGFERGDLGCLGVELETQG